MADIASNLYSWSTTAASNAPSGATVIGTGMDDNLREIQAVVRAALASVGADIASAGTTDIGAVSGLSHTITGTTTITNLGTVSAGIWKVLTFAGVLTLTHNGTSLILPGAANITTAAGDVAVVQSLGSGNWKCWMYQRASGLPVVNPSPTRLPTYTTTQSITTNDVLTDADGYQMLLAGGGGTFTITMPDTTTLAEGWYVRIVNNGSILTIARAGSDTFVGPGLATATTTSFTLPYTGSAELGYNFGAVTLTKFGTTWRVEFDSTTHGAQLFTGNGTWVCPFGVNRVWLTGCGGGGGGGASASGGQCGGGGGAQAIVRSIQTVVPGVTYTITIGAAGTGQVSGGAAATAGGATSMSGSGFSTVTLTGGGAASAFTGGAAGGAGGSAGSTGSSGNNLGCIGGGSIFGQGGSSAGTTAASGYGAGGAGGGSAGVTGTNGTPGFLLIEW